MLFKLDSSLAHLSVGLLVVHLAIGLLHVPRSITVSGLGKRHVCLGHVIVRLMVLSQEGPGILSELLHSDRVMVRVK